jgi:hypothetical protein
MAGQGDRQGAPSGHEQVKPAGRRLAEGEVVLNQRQQR